MPADSRGAGTSERNGLPGPEHSCYDGAVPRDRQLRLQFQTHGAGAKSGEIRAAAFGGDRLDGVSVREVTGGGQHAQLGDGGDWLLFLHPHAQAATLPGVHVPLQQQPEAEDDSRRQLLLPLVLLLRGEV